MEDGNLDSSLFAKYVLPKQKTVTTIISTWACCLYRPKIFSKAVILDVRRGKQLCGLVDNVVYFIKNGQSPFYVDAGGY